MIRIPQDMNRPELAELFGCQEVCSARDMLLLLGASDESLREVDERQHILNREPWRRCRQHFQVIKRFPNGMKIGFVRGAVDWSGTRFS